MIRSITKDKQDTLKSLLSTNTPYSRIQKQLPNISLATISRYKAKFFPTTKPAITGRPCSISNTTKKYIRNKMKTGQFKSPQDIKAYLISVGINMTIRNIQLMLHSMGFKAKRKQESDFISESNRKKRLAWAKQHRVLAKDDWRKWIFSDKTKVNIWASDGIKYYWSQLNDVVRPHYLDLQIQ